MNGIGGLRRYIFNSVTNLKSPMHPYTLIAPAKINLYLEIIGDRPDGYHQLVMVLQSIDLADRLEVRPNSRQEFRLSCQHPQVPNDKTNLAYRAAELMAREFPQTYANYGGADIILDKQIPVAAGLAGGSADAAAVLVGLDLVWNLGLTQPELRELAAKLGSDVPFCLAGGTAIATGRGEQLDPIRDLENLWVVLAKYRNLAISTPWAYQTYRERFSSAYARDTQDVASRTVRVHSGPLVSAISHQEPASIGKLLHNDLEKVVLPEFPQVAQLREAMQAAGGLGTMMSGSGPTIFTLCESAAQAEAVRQKVRNTLIDPELDFWIAKLSSTGIKIQSGLKD
jgi:4-diphosphocytidyl-2-C-methyl-D-erythritol kinase